MGISVIFTLLFFSQGGKNMHYKAVVFQQISRNKRVWLLVIYNKKAKTEKIWENFGVRFCSWTRTSGSSAFGTWKRGLWLCFPHGQLLGRCQISASSQDQSFGWHPHPSLHIKKNPSSSSPKNTARPWNTASFSAAPHQSSCWTWSKPQPGRKRSCLVEASSHVGLLEMSSSQKEQKSSLSLSRDFSSALITLFLFFFGGWGEGMDVVF